MLIARTDVDASIAKCEKVQPQKRSRLKLELAAYHVARNFDVRRACVEHKRRGRFLTGLLLADVRLGNRLPKEIAPPLARVGIPLLSFTCTDFDLHLCKWLPE